jgi:hypothetical protein
MPEEIPGMGDEMAGDEMGAEMPEEPEDTNVGRPTR